MNRLLSALLIAGAALQFPCIAEQRFDIQYRYREMDSTFTLNDLAFPDAKHGIACGFTTDRRGKDHPISLTTSDGGEHWAEQPLKEEGLALFFLDSSTGWMVGEKGIWFTDESGKSWAKLRNSPADILRVWFLDRQHGYAAGLKKRVFETTDGGETWSLLPIVKEVQGDPNYTTFGEIAFSGENGIISGWNVPPQAGGPDWMDPEQVKNRPLVPHLTILLETTNGGKTWKPNEASLFGQVTRISMTPQGTGLGLIEFKDEFEYASEVYRIDLHTGKSDRAYRDKDRAITDVRLFPGSTKAIIAGYEPSGPIHRSPIPGKVKVLMSDDLEKWNEIPVDYRAVAHSVIIAGPDENHLWIATDTGMILKLVNAPE